MVVVIFVTTAPLLYMMIGQFFEIDIYYLPNVTCGYEIFSRIPFYEMIQYLNVLIILVLPFLSVFFNYKIYVNATRTMSISNTLHVNEIKILFKGITIQSIFPFICQVPAISYILYYSATRNRVTVVEIAFSSFYYIGNGICIFLSLIIIREFRKMMINDFRGTNIAFPISNTVKTNRIKSIS
uniref:G-protein coupled receptors family 1 profile domain-containing protein n=1 Tax=Strongyloides venezuelensis TaxID=75913 RepID=A0A0K0FIR2_STRVS